MTKCNCRKKAECAKEENCQVIDTVYKSDVTRPLLEKVYLVHAEGQLNTSLNTRCIPRRRHFQVTCATLKVFQLKDLA